MCPISKFSFEYIIWRRQWKRCALPRHNTGCFSRRWPFLGARKSAPKKLEKTFFFKDNFYSLKVDVHYFTVFIYLATWSGAKLGIFTNFTFTNLPSCCLSMNSLIYAYFIQISSCFFWVLNHSCDRTSSHHHRPKKFSVLSPDCIANYKTELISKN